VERREFTVLHKIVLGLVQKDLEQELKASTAEINIPEIIGRTPLSMAAERSEVEAVATLLKYGADPGISSYSQTSALHYAATAKNPECVRLLLEAGVDVDCMTNWDQTPLHFAAAFTKDVRHAKLLLDYGADPNKRDRDGIVPLSWCAISNNPGVATVLLERGADVEGVDNKGSSALQRAIKSNRHDVLKMIVQKKPRVEACVPEDVSIWHLIATNADLETIRIICQLDYSGTTDINEDSLEASAIETLQERLDSIPELRAAFGDLLQSVRTSGNGDDRLGIGQEEEDVWEDARERLED
jgi:ankyrin repeat protein